MLSILDNDDQDKLHATWFILWWIKADKVASDKSRLPKPEDFSKALYTFDVGQNDLAAAFRKMSWEELRAALPDIVNQFAKQIRVN